MAEEAKDTGITTGTPGTILGGAGAGAAGGESKDPKAGEGSKTEPGKDAQTSAAGEGGKDAGGEKKPEATPEEIELKFPAGYDAGPSVEGFTKLAKELGLKSDAAQKVLDFYLGVEKDSLAEAGKAAETARREQLEGWHKELQADKEFGGAKFKANVETAFRAVEHFGGKELAAFFANDPKGNYPPLVKAFWKIGQQLAEDSVEGTASRASHVMSELEQQREFYKKSPEMFATKES